MRFRYLTKQFIFKRTLGGHLWASFRAFSSTKSRRIALGTPPILSTKNPVNLLQIWLAEYALKYELLSSRVWLTLYVTLVCLTLSGPLPGAGSIIQITRALRMSNSEAMAPKDFYLDVGHRHGVKEGDILEVYRWLPVNNVFLGAPYHLVKVMLGEVRITIVEDSTSIARLHRYREAKELPAMESPSIMLGDQVKVNSKTSLPFQ